MLGSSSDIYEVVTGQILLGQKGRFFELHREVLLPMMKKAGIEPVVLLVTELGRYQRFLDIYKYTSLSEYGRRTDQLLMDPGMQDYYEAIQECVDGPVQVELALEFPHFQKSARD